MIIPGQKGLGSLVIIIAVLILMLTGGGVYYYETHQNASTQFNDINKSNTTTPIPSPTNNSIPSPSMPLTTATTQNQLKIANGNIYRDQTLLINKKDCTDGSQSMSQYLNYTSFNYSADNSKILLFGDATLSFPVLCYTAINPIMVQYIGIGEEAAWSHNSRYIAYNSQPTDAGGPVILKIYDTQNNKNLNLSQVPTIKNIAKAALEYTHIGWQNDDSGVKVHYLARSEEPYGDNLGEGDVVIPLSSFSIEK